MGEWTRQLSRAVEETEGVEDGVLGVGEQRDAAGVGLRVTEGRDERLVVEERAGRAVGVQHLLCVVVVVVCTARRQRQRRHSGTHGKERVCETLLLEARLLLPLLLAVVLAVKVLSDVHRPSPEAPSVTHSHSTRNRNEENHTTSRATSRHHVLVDAGEVVIITSPNEKGREGEEEEEEEEGRKGWGRGWRGAVRPRRRCGP